MPRQGWSCLHAMWRGTARGNRRFPPAPVAKADAPTPLTPTDFRSTFSFQRLSPRLPPRLSPGLRSHLPRHRRPPAPIPDRVIRELVHERAVRILSQTKSETRPLRKALREEGHRRGTFDGDGNHAAHVSALASGESIDDVYTAEVAHGSAGWSIGCNGGAKVPACRRPLNSHDLEWCYMYATIQLRKHWTEQIGDRWRASLMQRFRPSRLKKSGYCGGKRDCCTSSKVEYHVE